MDVTGIIGLLVVAGAVVALLLRLGQGPRDRRAPPDDRLRGDWEPRARYLGGDGTGVD